MRELQQQTLLDDEATLVTSGEEATLVAPRFDAEETLVARPVVPLEADAPPALPAPAARSPRAPRRTGMLALVLTSVLVGGVLGGAGLYLYQRQSQGPPATETTNEPAAPAADAAALPAPAAEVRPAEPSPEPTVQPTEAPATAATNAPNAEETTPPAPEQEEPAAAPAREPESVPAAAERRTAPAEATPKRGKKGEHDEEVERRTSPPRPDGNVARAAEPQARRVDSIFYRPRRANRRPRRDGDDVDRLRRIFEGGPQ